MHLSKLFALARSYANNSSAKLCIADAENLSEDCRDSAAAKRLCDSLKYSVGIFHPAYKEGESLRTSVDIAEKIREEFDVGFDSVE